MHHLHIASHAVQPWTRPSSRPRMAGCDCGELPTAGKMNERRHLHPVPQSTCVCLCEVSKAKKMVLQCRPTTHHVAVSMLWDGPTGHARS